MTNVFQIIDEISEQERMHERSLEILYRLKKRVWKKDELTDEAQSPKGAMHRELTLRRLSLNNALAEMLRQAYSDSLTKIITQ
jgi:hypothetical protein